MLSRTRYFIKSEYLTVSGGHWGGTVLEAEEEMLKALKFALPNIADWSERGTGDSPRENRAYRFVLRALECAESGEG